MLYLLTKGALSGLIIMAASEVARRSPAYGALLVSLPLVAILTMVWLWRDTGDSERIAVLSGGTFWLVLPTLPMFLAIPALLRHGVSLSHSLSFGGLATSKARDQRVTRGYESMECPGCSATTTGRKRHKTWMR